MEEVTATADLASQLEPSELDKYRTELTGYCYRMLGSSFEAEDAVQDTLVRAWKSADRFEGRSAVRTWLYRIATNVCLTMLEGRQRRAMPVDMGPVGNADVPIGPQRPEIPWLEPMPDARVIDLDADPAESAVMRDSVRLAFMVALQHLPPKQRAVLVLREVLRWSAEEVARLLDTSVASVNSALQRARATLETGNFDVFEFESQNDSDKQSIAQKYAESFERYDMDAIVSMLHDEVVLSMPPFDLWLQGPEQVRTWLLGQGFGCSGSRLVATEANGTIAFGQYRKDAAGGFSPWALQVIDTKDGKVSGLTSFLETDKWFPMFDLPARLD